MNIINCPKCGLANEADLNFCLNCGAALNQSPVSANRSVPPNSSQPNWMNFQSAATQLPKRGGAGKNLAIFGGLGCIALALGSVALLGLLYVIGTSNKNQNARNVAIVNINQNRRQTTAANTVYNSNSSASQSTSGASDDDNVNANGDAPTKNAPNELTEEQAEKMFAEQLGSFKRQGEIVFDGNTAISGAEKSANADYAFNNKTVEATVVEFITPSAAKSGYAEYLRTSRAAAKIYKREKLKGKPNADGEYVLYTFKENGKTQHESLFYTNKYAFHIAAPDQVTLSLFLIVFAANAQAESNK